MLTLARTAPPRSHRGLRCLPLTDTRWRVVRADGAVVGYLDERPDGQWAVLRMTRDLCGFIELDRRPGFAEAVDALRLA